MADVMQQALELVEKLDSAAASWPTVYASDREIISLLLAAATTIESLREAALRAAPEGFVLVPVEPTREMMDAGRTAVMAAKLASQKWTPRQHYEASGKSTAGIPEDVLDERGPLTKESVAVMVHGAMLAARPQGVNDAG